MKVLSTILFLFCFNLSSSQEDLFLKNQIRTITLEGSFYFYTVIKFTDLNTSETFEICLNADLVRSAIIEEYDIIIEAPEDLKKVEDILRRYNGKHIGFKNKNALDKLKGSLYSLSKLKQLESKINFDQLAQKIKQKGEWSIKEDQTAILYSHALFKRGIITGGGGAYYDGLIHYFDFEEMGF